MLPQSSNRPMQTILSVEPGGNVSAKLQQVEEPGSRVTPDLVPPTDTANVIVYKPDIFLALETFRFKPKDEVPLIPLGDPIPPPQEMPPLEPVRFYDHFEPLDPHSNEAFVVQVPERKEFVPKEDKVRLNAGASALNQSITTNAVIEVRRKSACACLLKEPKPNPEESLQSTSNKLISNYQINILRKSCLRVGRRESSIDLSGSFDKDSTGLRKPFERKLTSEFESVASNNTNTTDCDDKSLKRTQKRSSPAQLIRSYSLGHDASKRKLNGTFKKFSLPTPASQLKESTVSGDAHGNTAIGVPTHTLDSRKVTTLARHYYPEGGWGFVVASCSVMVHVLCHGLQLSAGVLISPTILRFNVDQQHAGWLGAMSTAVALLLSPVTIAFCRRKSTRVTAVVGGLITALGCLFTSFASQFHQLFFSYGTVIGVGVGLTRDCSTLMVAQYFKRRRELVEIFIVAGSGLGIAVMSTCIKAAISAIGWRLGLQAVTGAVFLTFILGTFYRSASLYHPQRRAILHLKNQKRKIKDKNRSDDRPAFLDTSTLRSKTVRILLVSTGISAFGINTPIFYLARQAEQEGLGEKAVGLLQTYLGLAWVLGCAAFGLVVVHNSVECRIARQYLCQAAVMMCGLAILALTTVSGNYHGYVLFVWIYGIFCGGYHYSLKMYTYERVRARNFARTWGFVQCSQAIPIALGVPISGYMNESGNGKAGYYFSSTCTLAGSLAMFLIDVHRRRIARHKHTRANGQRHLCESDACPRRRPSIGAEPDPEPQLCEIPVAELLPGQAGEKPELTCISEEGIADMDLPDNLLDDLDYIGITSCNKVENYLMLSEFENNLIAETPVVTDKRGRRWSLARRPDDQGEDGGRWRLVAPKRTITVIDEASV